MLKRVTYLGVSVITIFNVLPLYAHTVIYSDAKIDKLNLKKSYVIQVGSFSSNTNATTLKHHLANQLNNPVYIKHEHSLYRVFVGPVKAQNLDEVFQRIHNKPTHAVAVKPKKIAVLTEPVVINQKQELLVIPVSGTNHWVVGMNTGANQLSVDNNITVNNGSNFSPPLNQDRYSTGNDLYNGFIGGLVGYRWERATRWFPDATFGLKYQYTFNHQITGTITQYSLPEFTNYTYNWKTSTNLLTAFSKINLIKINRVSPYVEAGIGSAWNRSSGYMESALAGVTPRISPAFSSASNAQFAYELGTGIDVSINEKVIANLGYTYQDLGQLSSGFGQGSWSSTALKLNDLQSNQVIFGVTYLFDGKNSY